jgi:hypothetical protein
VLIDAKVVIIDTSDDFSLGVEISGGDAEGGRRLFGFSSFGLSEVDAATGALSLVPGLGFNGTLVDPEIADVVLRALSDHHRSRVTSAPRVLVNDNAEGQLSSVAEVPFTSELDEGAGRGLGRLRQLGPVVPPAGGGRDDRVRDRAVVGQTFSPEIETGWRELMSSAELGDRQARPREPVEPLAPHVAELDISGFHGILLGKGGTCSNSPPR